MSNLYYDHLDYLRNVKLNSRPVLSLYVPLKWIDFHPAKIFSALLKAANDLLLNNGYSSLEITKPDWDLWISQRTVTLAIFHHNGITSLIPIPTKMKPRVVVAKSFHVKPIISAAEEHIDSLLLHFNQGGASLYRVNSFTESLINSYMPLEVLPKVNWPARLDRQSINEFLDFLLREVRGSVLNTTKMLGITGGYYSELRSESFWKQTKLPIALYDDSFQTVIPENTISIMRLRLAQMINDKHTLSVERVLKGSKSIEENDSVKKIVPKILNQEINRLCVSLDCMYFGDVDPHTGAVVIHKSQLNTRDDDVLDDMVELALSKGIEVSVVPKKYLPPGRSFAAS